jgi:hypothetical protein
MVEDSSLADWHGACFSDRVLNQTRRMTMKTTLKNIAMKIGLCAVLGSAALFADGLNRAIANIPFDFQVRGKTMPAGKYMVSRDDLTSATRVQNLVSGQSLVVLTHPGKSSTREEPKLIFNHQGEEYALSEVWFPGGRLGYLAPAENHKRSNSERGLVATVRLIRK